MESIKKFLREEGGITAAEYGILLGLITAAVIVGMGAFYTELSDLFKSWGTWFGAHHAP